MKKICSFVFFLKFSIIACLILLGAELFSVFYLVKDIKNSTTGQIIVDALLVVFFAIFLFLWMFALNRICSKVWYDANSQELKRKGFFVGYKYKINISQIKEVCKKEIFKETTYLIFIDEKNNKTESGRKNSYIRIEDTPKNREFIKNLLAKQ